MEWCCLSVHPSFLFCVECVGVNCPASAVMTVHIDLWQFLALEYFVFDPYE